MHLPTIDFSAAKKGEALVLGWFQEKAGASGDDKSARRLAFVGERTKEVDALSARLESAGHFRGKKNEVELLRFFPVDGHENTILLGLGSRKKWSTELARQAGAALYLTQKRAKLATATLQGASVFHGAKEDERADFVQAFCEGYLLAGHEFTELKKKDNEAFAVKGLSIAGLSGKWAEQRANKARILAEAVEFARWLGDRPGNLMTPTILAQEAQRMAKEAGLQCTVLDKAAIEKEKMGLLLGVSRGSHEEPRFIILEYKGGKSGDAPIALVGKGVTFDSGGISLKPAAQMEDMKYDMMGAATVIAVMQAIAHLKLPLNVTGFVPATENLPGGSAQKPGDVVRSLSGKTVEITNTDAEGRLILADALEYAQKRNPSVIMDFATLTGAVVVALGTVCTGIMGNHRGLIKRFKKASTVTGEKVWELPLFEEYEEDLRSHYADIKNSGSRDAGSSKGGIFLKHFIDSKFPWIHCDIAGAAYHRKDVNYHPSKYGSGAMIRLVVHLLEGWKPLDA